MRLKELFLTPGSSKYPDKSSLRIADDTDYMRAWYNNVTGSETYQYVDVPANFYKKKISVTIEFEGCFPTEGVTSFPSDETECNILFDTYKIKDFKVESY